MEIYLSKLNGGSTYDLPIKKTQIYRLDFVSFVSGKKKYSKYATTTNY